MTAPTLTCPAFCVSPHREPAGTVPWHADQPTTVHGAVGDDLRVDLQWLAGDTDPYIYVDGVAFTAEQADALIDAIAARVAAVRRLSPSDWEKA